MKFNIKKDIEAGLKRYPSLTLFLEQGKPRVQGIFTAYQSSTQIEDYGVLIGFPANYPYSLPWVIETSHKIPRDGTRHIFNDDTLCFGNYQDVWRVCKNGITFLWFLDKILKKDLKKG